MDDYRAVFLQGAGGVLQHVAVERAGRRRRGRDVGKVAVCGVFGVLLCGLFYSVAKNRNSRYLVKFCRSLLPKVPSLQ